MPGNLLHPLVLCFVAGVVAGIFRTGLRLPGPVTDVLSIYLLFAIGLKGGTQMSAVDSSQLVGPISLGLVLSFAVTIIAFLLLLTLVRLGREDASAVAAHYGSVSAVTFAVAIGYIQAQGHAIEPFMPILLAILEIPGIAMAIALGHLVRQSTTPTVNAILKELLLGKSIFLLLTGLLIGTIIGPHGMEPLNPFFVELFPGILCLFILDLGAASAERIRDLKQVGARLTIFATLMPLVAGTIAAWSAVNLAQLSIGGTAVLAALVASASYIAAPAATRIALPAANPTLSLFAALGITFPINITVGIPLYYNLALRFSH